MTPESQPEYGYTPNLSQKPELWYEMLVEQAMPRVLEKHGHREEHYLERHQRDSAVHIALAVEAILDAQTVLISRCGQQKEGPDFDQAQNSLIRFQLYMVSKGMRPEGTDYFVLLTPEAKDLYEALIEFQCEWDDFVITDQRNNYDYFDSSALELISWGLAYTDHTGHMRLNDFEHDHFKNNLEYKPPFQLEEFEEVVAAAIRARTEPIPRRPKLVQMA